MFKNYLKIAYRKLLRHKIYSLINISGLGIGIACFILILLYVQYELSYDRYHENVEQIYRVVDDKDSQTPGPLAPALLDDFPAIINTSRIQHFDKVLIGYRDKKFYEERIFFTDPSIFEIFTFPFIKGNPKTALKDPNSIVITHDMAKKFLGDDEPIGKIINYDNKYDFKITGILENVPLNSHFKFDFLASFSSVNGIFPNAGLDKWNVWRTYTYVLLEKNISPAIIEQQFPQFISKYLGEGWVELVRLNLQPLKRIHLHSNLWGEIETNSDIKYIYLFSAIAFFILLIACINYMNLSTARYASRTKEVGIRKVFGAYRIQLIKQFMGESILIAFIALLLAIILIELFLPVFSNLIDRELVVNYHNNWLLLLGIIGIALCVGIVSGSYPALYLSAFHPKSVLRKTSKTGLAHSKLRTFLVMFQFAISVDLIFATIIIYNQLNYIRDKKLGFNKEQVVIIPILDRSIIGKIESIKGELLKNVNIINTSASSSLPSHIKWKRSLSWEGQNDNENNTMRYNIVDYDFIKTFEIELVEGRDFSREIITDTKKAYILNEAAIRKLGWESPIGKQIHRWSRGLSSGSVIGIIKDFHFKSLHEKIEPLILYMQPDRYNYLSIRISTNDIHSTLNFIKATFMKFSQNRPFNYFFMDEYFDKLYRAEEKFGHIFGYFTFLAIFISCLGLFGLASFTAEQRTNEIGIRKVLGASVSGIVLLLTKEFTKWVFFANLIAWPIAWYTMNKWLQNFAYRIDLTIWPFLLAGVLALLIALLTVSYQAIKAATANPVEVLRYE